MKLGNIEIKGKAVLAPMAGTCDMAFRELCVKWGATYVVGEMASAKGITLGDRKSRQLLILSDAERPGAVQIFGDEPETMARAAQACMAYRPDAIDINMGCPAPKVVMNGGGSALLKQPELAGRIVRAVAAAVDVPVTVKLRAGWDADSVNAVEMAQIAQDNGAAAVAVHGRTRAQMYAGRVDYDIIRQVKAAVEIPVFGNGDITNADSAVRMLEETGCDLLMVGRGALGAPWLFRQINAYLETGARIPAPPVQERMEIMLEHIAALCEYKGEVIGMKEARKHAGWYTRGLQGAAAFRREMGQLAHYGDLKILADKINASDKEQS